MSKNNCNHCKALRQSAEASVSLEIRLNNALDHIKEMEHEKLDYIIKVKELERIEIDSIETIRRLEQQKAELSETFNTFIREINSMCFKAQSPLMDNSHQIDLKYLMKRCRELNAIIQKCSEAGNEHENMFR